MSLKLKVGLMIDSYHVAAWKYDIIKKISDSDFASVAVVIKNSGGQSTDKSWINPGMLVFRLHKKLDKIIFGNKNDYSQEKDFRTLIKMVPEVTLTSVGNGDCQEFPSEDIEEIRKYDPDVILKFGSGLPGGRILKVPAYGVWSYSMDNLDNERTGITGYYEVVRYNPVTKSELVILNGCDEKAHVISDAWESTCSYSIHMNRDRLFWRSSLFTIRVLQGIHQYGKSYLEDIISLHDINSRNDSLKFSIPSFTCSVRNFAAAIMIFSRKSFKKVFYSDPFSWVLLFKIKESKDFLNNSYSTFNKLKPSKDKFWADPFVISRDDKYFVFVEEFIYAKNKGHISVLELDKGGKLITVKKLIDKPYHMSYPFVFESEGVYYMIPETGENRTIDLYKCIDFPGTWVFVKSLMKDVNAVDTTLFKYDGKWWLFTVIDEINSTLDGCPELFLFFTDNILSGTWMSHPLNPVVSDIRTARPAGRVFIHNENIYRPSQDCAGRYGKAFNIIQILTLSETNYKEVQIKKIEPDWDTNLKGTHTFNFDDDFTVIDAYSMRRRQLLN
jgi:hypothetical protein